MDKNTLSQYGWVTIVIIIIVILLGFASPFGMFMKNVAWETIESFKGEMDKQLDIFSDEPDDDTLSGGSSAHNGGPTHPSPSPTHFTIEEINSNQHIVPIGKTQPEYVVAIFNDDYTSVTFNCNGDNSDGLIMENPFDISVTTTNDYPFYGRPYVSNYGVLSEKYPDLKTAIIKSGVKYVPSALLSGSDTLESVTIEEGVQEFGPMALAYCPKLTSIHLPSTVTTMWCGFAAFDTSLTKITVDKNNPEYVSVSGVLCNISRESAGDSEYWVGLFAYPAGKTDKKFIVSEQLTGVSPSDALAFNNCDNMTSFRINQFSFAGCQYLEDVSITDEEIYVDEWAFYKCPVLTQFTINPTAIEGGQICREAFFFCDMFNDITIYENMLFIDNSAFDCENLTTIKCAEGSYADDWAQSNGYDVEYI